MKTSPAGRSRARRFAMQALYQSQMTGDPIPVVERQFREDNDMKRVDTLYLNEVLSGISVQQEDLWEIIDPCLERDRKELGAIEKSILLLGTFELSQRIDVPYRVVINEAVDLARLFGGSESYRLINSVLDKIAKSHRQVELGLTS